MAETARHDKTSRQLRLLSQALDAGRLGPVRRLVNTLSPAEIGNLLDEGARLHLERVRRAEVVAHPVAQRRSLAHVYTVAPRVSHS